MLLELTRLRAEYLKMLKREQVQGLCGLERAVCERVLATLVDTRFLCVTANGTYARVTDGADVPRPLPFEVQQRKDADLVGQPQQ